MKHHWFAETIFNFSPISNIVSNDVRPWTVIILFCAKLLWERRRKRSGENRLQIIKISVNTFNLLSVSGWQALFKALIISLIFLTRQTVYYNLCFNVTGATLMNWNVYIIGFESTISFICCVKSEWKWLLLFIHENGNMLLQATALHTLSTVMQMRSSSKED